MKSYFLHIIILLLFFDSSFKVYSNNTIVINKNDESIDISSKLLIFEDKKNSLSINDVIQKEFLPTKSQVPNLGFSKSAFWLKTTITNNTKSPNLFLEISLPILDFIEFYSPKNENQFDIVKTGEEFNFNTRKYKDPNYLFDINIQQGETKTYYLKIRSNESIQLPIKIGTQSAIYSEIKNRDILSGLYVGIMLVMVFYNLFIYFSVKDKSYIYYVLYVLLVLLTQTCLEGYPFQYLWPSYPVIAKYSLFIFPSLVGITSMIFMNVFLKVRYFSTNLYKLSFVFSIIYLIPIVLVFLGLFDISQKIMEICAGVVSIYMLITAILIVRKGYQPAKYFLAAWAVFLIGVVIFILKDLEILPYNNFTRYTMQIGSAIETVLLSFALAARINDYKKEKEASQLLAYQALEEKETLVREQNVMLENKVTERTLELKTTLNNLKETQSQLVDAEKMASLGQLTAGVAHEINNPINFVSSNISPLKQDINDLKTIIEKYGEINSTNVNEKLEEIETLKKELDYHFLTQELETIISSIENGANRTTEIVRSLRNFSRLDESDLMLADINEGIESTLILLQSEYKGIEIKKELGELPKVECYPGKLNQVFLNILNNAIHAVRDRKNQDEKGTITISTSVINDKISVSIKDNGVGMNKETQNKIFDPFFTTKEVGKGTGLGLSIVYRIIENHQGTIIVESEENKGTIFTLNLPKHQKQ